MTATILESIGSMRASLDELETAYHTAAVSHYNEVAGRLAQRLGAPQLPELLALPALRALQRRGAAARDGRPKHRKEHRAMGALDVEGLEELDAGHTVAVRAGVGVEE
jgi:hypothetical protein